MSEMKTKKFSHEWGEHEPPPKKLISEGDILIKKLVENQKKTDITLQQHLMCSKQFEKGADITPLSRYNPGTSNLSDIINSTNHFNNIEHLKAAGLTDQDAQLYIDSLKGHQHLYSNHKNWEKSILQEHLEKLKKMVQIYESKASQPTMQKNLLQYGLAIKPQSVETKLLRFALENTKDIKPVSTSSVDIKDIEKQRFEHLADSYLPPISVIRKKSRKLQRRLNTTPNFQDIPLKPPVNSKSKWDIKTNTESVPNIPIVEKKVFTCLPRSYYTIRNGEIVKLTNSEISTKHLDVAPKLSLEEIKELPKFKGYSPGVPSKVLYLKNLSNSVKEEDLRRIFKEFASDVKDYKLMRGRLRGQAFVTFEDDRIASKAMEELNGILLSNKPVIMQYGYDKR